MKKQYFDWHGTALFIVALLYAAFEAAYPYLNPSDPDWQKAIFQAAAAIIGLIIYQHGRIGVKRELRSARAELNGMRATLGVREGGTTMGEAINPNLLRGRQFQRSDDSDRYQ